MLEKLFGQRSGEQRLLEQVRQGHQAAMAELYSRYVRYLSAICSRYVASDEDVKDVLQEAFLRVFSSIGEFQYKGEGSLRAWMARIVLNESLTFLRRSSRMSFSELPSENFDLPDEEPPASEVPSDVLHRFIRELPDGYRTVFNLYVVEQRSHKEIGALLGIKPDTSASQLHKAKQMLAAKVKHYKQANTLPL